MPDLPQNDTATPIALPMGECLIPGSHLLDYFDFKAIPIKIRNPATFFLTSLTIGYRYYLGMVFGVCWGYTPQVDGSGAILREILINGKHIWGPPAEVTEAGLITNNGSVPFNQQTPGYIYKPTFFGGAKQEGGIVAKFIYYNGADLSSLLIPLVADPYWETQRGVALPHYKDLAYLVWYGPSTGSFQFEIGGGLPDIFTGPPIIPAGYIGNTNHLWPISFKVTRLPEYFGGGPVEAGLGTTPGSSGPHANPISCLYECFINDLWGAGINPALMDVTAFTAAATTCWSEGLGYSHLWTTASPVEEMVSEILSFVDGTIWTDIVSGLITIKLSRADYVAADLEVLNNDDLLEIESFTRGAWEDTKGEVRLTFTDHTTPDFAPATAYWQDLANVQMRGYADAAEITFNGCAAMDQAARLAQREGRVLATPLARLTAKVDRKMWQWYPGKVFKFSWTEQGITELIMRVTGIKLGTLVEGTITINAVEDVFAAGTAVYGTTNTTRWTDPVEGDAEDAEVIVGEIPYFIQRDSSPRVFASVARPDAKHISFDGVLDGAADVINADFAPTGLLRDAYPQLSTTDYDNTETLILDNLSTDIETILVGTASTIANDAQSLTLLGDPQGEHEWIAFEAAALDTGELTLNKVWRGLLDTPPRPWLAGTPVWFYDVGAALFSRTLMDGQTVGFQALTRTATNQLRDDQATEHSLTIESRALKPLPPYYVTLGGSYANEEQSTGDVVLAWREHSRLTMAQVLKQSATTETAEATTEYEVEVYDDADVLIHTETGLSSPTYTYTNSQELSDTGDAVLELRLKFLIYSVRDGLRSFRPFLRYVFRVDPGSFSNSSWILPAQVVDEPRATESVSGWDQTGIESFD